MPSGSAGRVPTAQQAADISRELLGSIGTRLPHVLTAASVARRLAPLFDPADADLLVAAATLHDIGYAPGLRHTGFHPLDGGLYLAEQGYSPRLAALVAHHSLAVIMAPGQGVSDLEAWFPRERSLVADALAFSDMHSAPDGTLVAARERIGDIAARHSYPGNTTRCKMLMMTLARVRAAAGEHERAKATVALPDGHSGADLLLDPQPTSPLFSHGASL